MTDYKALCAELLQSVEESDDYILAVETTVDLVIRTRAALAAEPEPPADGEVAELVAWLWSMHELAGEHNPEEQCRYARTADLLERLVPQPVPEGPTQDEIMSLAYEYFTFRGNSHRDSFFATSIEAKKDPCASLDDFVRAVLARWGQ